MSINNLKCEIVVLTILAINLFASEVNSAKILAIIPFPGRSHYIFQQPLMEELARRGHEVTVITSYEEKNPVNDNYKQIVVDKRSMWDVATVNIFQLMQDASAFELMWYAWNAGLYLTESALNSTNMRYFMKHDNTKFDLVISEIFLQEALYAFAARYDAPLVTICTSGNGLYNHYMNGNPVSLAYLPHELLHVVGKMNFMQRIKNVLVYAFEFLGIKYYYYPKQQRLLEKYFKDLQPTPNINVLEKSVSLSFINTHFSVDRITPTVPSFIEIGGIHIKEVTPLEKDISDFIETAPNGVIYFSLGSNLQSNNMEEEKINAFLKVFSRLPERVIWKWENDVLPNKTDNILIRKWLPQSDILAHPNVKLFITHGGLLSMHEALYTGVPIVGIPVYFDQGFNVANAINNHIGVRLPFKEITEETVGKALKTILDDPEYNVRAKELSLRFRDRPLSAMDSAIFWIEYLIRNKGAKYMRSPIADFYWYEYYMIDIIFCLVIASCFASLSALYILRYFIKKCIFSSQGKRQMEIKKRK